MMRNCPFCNADVNADPIGVHYNKLIDMWTFSHNCGEVTPVDVFISVYGKTKEEVVRRWNGEEQTSESL